MFFRRKRWWKKTELQFSVTSLTVRWLLWAGFRATPHSLAVSWPPDVGPGPAVFISGCHFEITRWGDTDEPAQIHPSCSQSSISDMLCFYCLCINQVSWNLKSIFHRKDVLSSEQIARLAAVQPYLACYVIEVLSTWKSFWKYYCCGRLTHLPQSGHSLQIMDSE